MILKTTDLRPWKGKTDLSTSQFADKSEILKKNKIRRMDGFPFKKEMASLVR